MCYIFGSTGGILPRELRQLKELNKWPSDQGNAGATLLFIERHFLALFMKPLIVCSKGDLIVKQVRVCNGVDQSPGDGRDGFDGFFWRSGFLEFEAFQRVCCISSLQSKKENKQSGLCLSV